MRVGCPKEIKNNENRVGLTPAGARAVAGWFSGVPVGDSDRKSVV